MAFLSINGWEIDILDGSFSVADVDVGVRGAGYGGSSRDARRAIGVQVKATTIFQDQWLSMPLEELLRGNGHHFSFDETLYADTASGRGVGPEAGYSASLVTAAPAPKYGTRCLKVPSATTISWIVNAPYDDPSGSGECTVMVWFWNGASWDHYVYCQAPAGVSLFKNGAYLSGAAPGNVSATVASDGSATVTLEGQNFAGANADAYFDDLVILPVSLDPNADGVVTDAISGFYANTQAFSNLPRLDVGGDWYRNGDRTIEMVGAVVSTSHKGGLARKLRSVEFTLTEAAPGR